MKRLDRLLARWCINPWRLSDEEYEKLEQSTLAWWEEQDG